MPKHSKEDYADLFKEASDFWDLERLYEDLADVKQKDATGQPRRFNELTPVERFYLRGLLCRNSPDHLAQVVDQSVGGIEVALSRGLYRYIEILVNQEIEDWRDVSNFLESEYKIKLSTTALTNSNQTDGTASAVLPRYDWGEAPDVSTFFGRSKELSTLEQWVIEERCRLVAILGMRGIGKTWLVKGGIGKTDLSLKLARSVQDEFEYIIWRRLLNAPPIDRILSDFIQFISNQKEPSLSATVDEKLRRLLHYLSQHRCLLILDNLETILQGGEQAGQYLQGLGSYGDFFKMIGETEHQSCLITTSREKPLDIHDMEEIRTTVRVLELNGLNTKDGRKIFSSIGQFKGTNANWKKLIEFYNGNPLALEIVAKHIKRHFGSNITHFLSERLTVFRRIRDLLDWHFKRLSLAEQEIMYWLAINREPILTTDLEEDILSSSTKSKVLEHLESLELQLPLERSNDRVTLQPVLIEYVCDQLIQKICNEIQTGEIELFNSHALVKASAKDYIRDSQARLILKPITEELISTFGNKELLENQLRRLLSALRKKHKQKTGYAAGNLINLFCQLETNISGYNFSELVVYQAYLQGKSLSRLDFSRCQIKKSIFTQNFGGIHSVAFSPDGNVVAIGDSNGDIRILKADNGQQLSILQGHSKNVWVTSIAFSSDGATLVSCSFDRTVRLWDIKTGTCLNVLSGHENWIWSVAFHPDGEVIASAGDDKTVRLWDVKTGTCLNVLSGHENWIWSIAFHPDKKVIASGSYDKTIKFWDLGTGECLKTLSGHENSIWSIAFSPDGQLLASGSLDSSICLWDVETEACLETIREHTKEVRSLAFSPDSRLLVSGSFDQTLRLRNLSKKQCITTLEGHATGIRSVTFSPDGKTILSGDNDQTLKFWDVETGQCSKTLRGYTNWIWTVAYSPDGNVLASGCLDQTIKFWNPHTGEHFKTLRGHTNWIWSTVFSPDGSTLASSSDDETIRLWNVKTGVCLRVLQGHSNGGVWTVAFSPNGEALVSGGQDGTVRVWSIHSNECQILRGHTNWVWSVMFSPDGLTVASAGDDQTIRLWDVSTGQEIMRFQNSLVKVMSISFSPNGKTLISGSDDGIIRLWSVENGECIRVIQGHNNWVMGVAFHPDGQSFASGSSDETIKIWDTCTGQCLYDLKEHTNWVRAVAFSPDGQFLASCSSDGKTKIWDSSKGKCMMTMQTERPYEGMNIFGTTGLTEAEKTTLKALGAIEIPHAQSEGEQVII